MNEITDPNSSYLVFKDAQGKSYVASSLRASESLSGAYEWQVSIIASDDSPSEWIGQEVSCLVYGVLGGSRTSIRQFKGFIVEACAQSEREGSSFTGVKLTVQPWFSLLRFSRKCRVFQDKSTQAIVESIFKELGFSGQYSAQAMSTATREYCVQFHETDYEFVRRLLAEEGAHFYQGKDEDSSKLCIQNAASPFSTTDTVTLDYGMLPTGDYEVISSWQHEHAFLSASLEIAGYDYNQTKLISSKAKKSAHTISGNSKLKEFVYPSASMSGDYKDLASRLAAIQRAQKDSSFDRVKAETASIAPCVGHYIKLNTHTNDSEKGQYLVTAIELTIENSGDDVMSTHTRFECVPKDSTFYPQAIEKPVLHGLQSAVVSGKKTGEPANDASGRVRIKFHWDDESGDATSCWVRVAQAMSGSSYGAQFLPRADQEVLVSFINGDPDQPVIVSSLYNSKNKPPYAEAESTQSGIKTKLAGESNELRFDDKKDNELLYMHAAKDFKHEVVNDHTETVGGNMSLDVTKVYKHTVKETFALSVTKDMSTKTEQNYDLVATKNITEKGSQITLEGEEKITLKVGDSSIVLTSDSIKLESSTIELSGSSAVKAEGGSMSIKGSPVDIVSSGSASLKSSQALSIKAGTSLSAKGSTGAAISGLNVDVKADVAATVKGSASAEISSSGMTTVKGSLVMVN